MWIVVASTMFIVIGHIVVNHEWNKNKRGETMAEISREDAIKNITTYVIAECKNIPFQVIQSLDEAREDMEKLEKIEKIIDEISDFDHEDCEFDLRMIAKIVKGE